MSDNRAVRGFSLLEVIGSLSIAAILITSLMGVLVDAEKTARRTRIRADLANNGTIFAQQLRQELSQAGIGVPTAKNIVTNVGVIYSSVIVASATEIGVVGDFPRPDANFNTFGFIDDRPGPNAHHLAGWHTENDGGCLPSTSGSCTTATTSLFFPGLAGCNTIALGEAGDRTCPWGLRRLRGNEPFQIVAGNRQWFAAPNQATLTVHNEGGVLTVHNGADFPAIWSNNSSVSLPNAGPGQGWVATVDRVFYRFVAANRTIERIQCWGTPNPDVAGWPLPAATAAPALPCAAPFEGMSAWEVVAQNVDSVQFRYFDSASSTPMTQPINTATAKDSIRRVEFNIKFSKTGADQPVKHDVVGGAFLSMIL